MLMTTAPGECRRVVLLGLDVPCPFLASRDREFLRDLLSVQAATASKVSTLHRTQFYSMIYVGTSSVYYGSSMLL